MPILSADWPGKEVIIPSTMAMKWSLQEEAGLVSWPSLLRADRHWITRDSAVKHLLKSVNFLLKANSYHGIFPHWLNGATGVTIPFSRKDDGADVVETSYLFEGLLCARQYFNQKNPLENQLRNKINWLWTGAEWSWHQRDMGNSFYWHWSPNNGWSMNFELRGWNECLITYVLSASSP